MNEKTPLHLAAFNNSIDTCKLLVTKGANIRIQDVEVFIIIIIIIIIIINFIVIFIILKLIIFINSYYKIMIILFKIHYRY